MQLIILLLAGSNSQRLLYVMPTGKAYQNDYDYLLILIVSKSSYFAVNCESMERTLYCSLGAGIRENLKTMVGGAAATEHRAAKIGADFWVENAGDAVAKLKETFC